MISILEIRKLELQVTLGWPDKERQEKQSVWLDLDIHFPSPPVACNSDNLEDTVCYADLITLIREKTASKNYHLIEHLSHEIYLLAKTQVSKQIKIFLKIKKHPQIAGLMDGVFFSYGDN